MEPGVESPTFASVNLILGLFGVTLCTHSLTVMSLFAAKLQNLNLVIVLGKQILVVCSKTRLARECVSE